ncbi:MAG: glycosyltransferase, partial [Phycisphaerae bacterium]
MSVILPVYNHAAMLGEAVESVLAQTYPDFELIILNDGSTDDIDAVFRRYQGHPRIRLLTQPNQKLPKALSNAFEFARGEFHTWTSADNLMEPRLLERLVAFLREHPDVEMVYADYVAIDDRGEPLRDPAFRPQNKRRPDSPEIHLPRDPRPLNTVDDNFIGACFLYRSRASRVLGEYAPELGCEDYDYWMRMNALFRIAHLGTDEVLYRYRVHDNTLSGRARELRISERVRALMEYERQRATFYAQPWEIVVDSVTEAWVSGADRGSHTVRRVADVSGPQENGRKRLFLIGAETLDRLSIAARGEGDCLAVWFDGDPAAPYRHRRMLREGVDLCLCGREEAAARAGLFAPNVFVTPSGEAALDLAVAFANNRV